jgi:uncharacterized protein (AIM24 family)
MAEFTITEFEGQRFVTIAIRKEVVRAEAGALARLRGDVEVFTPLPSIREAIACALSDEPLIRPRYDGSGEIMLEPFFGGYHIFTVDREAWVLENGAYWASDGTVKLGLFRERALTSLWAGESFVDYQTKVSGQGKVVLNASGPVEEIELHGDRISVEGKLVIARTVAVEYAIRRPTRSLIGYYLSGESLVRTYSGRGKILLVQAPYWSERLLAATTGRPPAGPVSRRM